MKTANGTGNPRSKQRYAGCSETDDLYTVPLGSTLVICCILLFLTSSSFVIGNMVLDTGYKIRPSLPFHHRVHLQTTPRA